MEASLVAQTVKTRPAIQETWVWFLDQEDCPEKGMTTTLSLLPGKFHGQRSLVGLIQQLTLSHPEYINSYNSKTTKNLIKKSAKDLHTHFSKRDIQMSHKHMKKCSKTPLGNINKNHNEFTSYPLVLVITKGTENKRRWQRHGKMWTLVHCWSDCKMLRLLQKLA